MFLARLKLNPRSHQARRDWADCQQLHRTLMSCFEDVEAAAARAELQVLFRREMSDTGQPVVLLQSAVAPLFHKLPALYVLAGEAAARSLDPLFQRIQPGAPFRFRLTANPSRKIETGRDSDKPNGRRVALRGGAAVEWLQRKAAQHGFELTAVTASTDVSQVIASPTLKLTGFKRDGSREHRLSVEAVTFDGALTVKDANLIQTALRCGIGPAKAYGCGLLSLAPLEGDSA